MLCEQPPGPGTCARRGLVARQEQSYSFITKLTVGHARTVSVRRREQHREQVPGVAAGSTPFRDDSVENFLDLSHFSLHAQVRGRGQPVRNKNSPPEICAYFQQLLQ